MIAGCVKGKYLSLKIYMGKVEIVYIVLYLRSSYSICNFSFLSTFLRSDFHFQGADFLLFLVNAVVELFLVNDSMFSFQPFSVL